MSKLITSIVFSFLILSIHLASTAARADGFFERAKTLQGFNQVINENLDKAKEDVPVFNAQDYRSQFEEKRTAFVPILHIHPGQVRFSYNNVVDKLTSEGTLYAIFPPNGGDPYLDEKNDNGKSFYPESQALNVVLTDFGLVLLDGHHGTITAIFYGAKTLPVKIVADYTGKEVSLVWKELESKGWAHLQSLSGVKKEPPPSFALLEDDILRYFTALVAFKILVNDPSKPEISKPKSTPLWIKINNSIPFIEFILSDVLYKSGFNVTPEMIAKKPMDANIVEGARKILLAARAANPALQHIDLFQDTAESTEVITRVTAVQATEESMTATNVAEYLKSAAKN